MKLSNLLCVHCPPLRFCFFILVQECSKAISENLIVGGVPHCKHNGMNKLMAKCLMSHLLTHSVPDEDGLSGGVTSSVLTEVVSEDDVPDEACENEGGWYGWFGCLRSHRR